MHILAFLQPLQPMAPYTRPADTPWSMTERTRMATSESRQRMERRRRQQALAALRARPDVQALLHDQHRRLRRHPYRFVHPGLLWLYCYQWGRELGGRPPKARRCTKRLGTRLCWNWRVNGTTRCHRHPQEGDT